MDVVTHLSNSENFYVIGDGVSDSEQYFIPSVSDEGSIGSVASSQEICNFDNTDEDIAQFFLTKQSKEEDKRNDLNVSLNIPENDPVIVMPDTDLLLEEGVIAPDLPILDEPVGSPVKSEMNDNNLIIEHMDIRSPLQILRELLEKRLSLSLTNYEFWLQNAQKLHPDKNLVEQCVQGEGLVQINCEIKPEGSGGKIIVVDVLKPAEEFKEDLVTKPESEGYVRWIVDPSFRNDTKRLKMPKDPNEWSSAHVKLWLVWAVRQFGLTGIKLKDWNMNGQELCSMTLQAFQKKVCKDPDDVFWTHLELLRKCHVVAVKHELQVDVKNTKSDSGGESEVADINSKVFSQPLVSPKRKPMKKVSRILGSTSITDVRSCGSSRNGNNGQIQLWQFLLELLTDKNHRDIIQWVSDDGQFRLTNPDVVAQMWGARKNKPTMNYEKLSRALRYYYDGDMIAKVPGRRFVYRFVCDLKLLTGYTASQLNQFVTACAIKNGLSTTYCDFYEHQA